MSEEILTVVAEMQAQTGKEVELKQALQGLLVPSRSEEGCLNYDMHESHDEKGKFLFYENWSSRRALDAHLETPHLKAFFSRVPELVAGDVKISFYSPVSV